MWLWLMKIPTQYQLIMPTGQSKTICGNASDKTRWTSLKLLQVVWWPILKPIQVAWPSPQLYKTVKTNLVVCAAIWWVNLQLMQLALSSGLWNQCKWSHLVANFVTNASGAIWWPTLQLVQVVSFGGQICKWYQLMTKFETNMNVPCGCQTLLEAQRTQGIDSVT